MSDVISDDQLQQALAHARSNEQAAQQAQAAFLHTRLQIATQILCARLGNGLQEITQKDVERALGEAMLICETGGMIRRAGSAD